MAQQRSPRSNATDSGADALKLLKADHRKVKKLFDEFEEIKDKPRSNQKKGELVRQICAELTLHAEAEEAILYPAARKVIKDEELMDEADVEHAGAKELIAQLEAMDPEDSHYDAKVTVLREYILHHVKEEESEMFPKIEKARLDREKLGDELAHFKEEHGADVESAIHDKR